MSSDARVRFDSGVILLFQSQFFAMDSNQWNCLILYRSQITSNGVFRLRQSGQSHGKGRRSRYVEVFWNKQKLYVK